MKARDSKQCTQENRTRFVEQVRDILATEFLVAAQALDLRRDVALPPRLTVIHRKIREKEPCLQEDRVPTPDLEAEPCREGLSVANMREQDLL